MRFRKGLGMVPEVHLRAIQQEKLFAQGQIKVRVAQLTSSVQQPMDVVLHKIAHHKNDHQLDPPWETS